MDSTSTTQSGFVHRLRLLADSLLAAVEGRLELFSVELQEEKTRLIQNLIWVSAGIFAAGMTLIFGSLTLVYLFWESARLPTLAILGLFYATAFLIIAGLFRRCRQRQPSPFAASLREIQKDRVCVSGN